MTAESRTIQIKTEGMQKVWTETLNVETTSQGRTETRELLGEIRVSKFDIDGRMTSLTVSKKGLSFRAERQGQKVAFSRSDSEGDKVGNVDLGESQWFDTWEQAGQFLLEKKKASILVLKISEIVPERNIVFEIKNEGRSTRQGIEVQSFGVSGTGMASLFMPKFHFWLDLKGKLVAQESFPMPEPGAGPNGPKQGPPPPGEMKMVLQEVVVVRP